jgi:transportin-3
MGEAYLPMIASERDCNQASIVEVLMACTEFPSRKVSQVPFRFWYHLAKAISKTEDAALQQKLRSVMSSTYVRLARLCVRLSARTENDLDGEDKDNDSDEYESHRQDLFEALGDCCCVIGNQAVLEAIAEELKVAAAPEHATNDGIESCLFALRGVADYVGHSDNSVIEPALQLTCTLPQDWRRARRQGAVLIGSYAKWLQRHPTTIQPCVQFLLEELSAEVRAPTRRRREPSASRAARALTALCHRCAAELAAANFVQVRDQIVNNVPLKDELSVLEGLGAVVAASSTYESVVQGTQMLARPPAEALALLAQSDSAEPRSVAHELDRLTAVMRCASPSSQLLNRRPHPVLEVFANLWPVFEAVVSRMKTSHLVIEKLCRCYKHAMRSCRKHFEPMLDRMTAHLIKSLQDGVQAANAGSLGVQDGSRHSASAPLSSFVYCCSICITEFGDEARMIPKLFEMVSQVSQACFALLQSPAHFAEHPDLVEEYFYLASRFLDYCPGSLLSSPLLGHILQSASTGLRVEHREALRGVLHFCGECTAAAVLALKKSGDALPPAMQADEPLQARDAPRSQEDVDLARSAAQSVRRLLVEQDGGRALVDGLLAALSGDLPAQFLEEGRGSLLGCLWKLRLFCPPEVFARWCGASLEVITANFASTEIAGDLLNAVSVDPPRRDAFHDAFVVFARCFQTNKRGRRRSHR